jgi:hypothetical protein
MVTIPEMPDPTLEAMGKAVLDNYSNQERDYLGASSIGEECARKIWYSYRKYSCEPFTPETIMRFQDGHYHAYRINKIFGCVICVDLRIFVMVVK